MKKSVKADVIALLADPQYVHKLGKGLALVEEMVGQDPVALLACRQAFIEGALFMATGRA